MTQAINFISYFALVTALARKHRGILTLDDAVAVGRMALYEASKNYDPSRGSPFSTHAAVAIKRSIIDRERIEARQGMPGAGTRESRRTGARVAMDALDALVSEDSDETHLDRLVAMGPSAEANALASEASDMVARLVDQMEMTDRERAVWRNMMRDEPETGAVLGARLGIGGARVSQIAKELRERARTLLAGLA